jgi:hypothetical protein
MAAHGAPEYSVAEGNDYPAHEQTYLNFISLVKWVGGFVVLIVAGMAYMELMPRITRASRWTCCRARPISPATRRCSTPPPNMAAPFR